MKSLTSKQTIVLEALDTQIQSPENDDEAIAYITAGSLEDLLGSDEGRVYLPYILNMARQTEQWRYALVCVWTSGFKDRAFAKQIDDLVVAYFPKGRP